MAKKMHPLVQGLFSFDGRMRRSEYWLTSFGLGVFKAVLTGLLALLTGQLETKDGGSASGIVELLFLWPTMAVLVKRGHDRNRSALFSIGLLVAVFIVAMVTAFSQMSGGTSPVLIIGVILTVAIIGYLFIDYGFIDGAQGPNRYGPSPKGIGPQQQQQDLATIFD